MRQGGYDPDRPVDPALRAGDVARRLLRARGLGSALVLSDVISVWESIVGASVAKHAQPKALRGPTLTIEVDAPAWATEMQFLAAEVLRKLAETLGESAPAAVDVTVAGQGSARRRR